MYNKLFTKILDSSIWLEPTPTRIVWLTLIASMDEDGFCAFAAPANLAHRAVVSREECDAALAVLEGPDPDSADTDHEGRRLERVPGGWIVRNAKKYGSIVSREESKRLHRERSQRYRERRDGDASVTPRDVRVTQSDTDTDTKTDRDQKQKKQKKETARCTRLPDVFPLTEELRNYAVGKGCRDPQRLHEDFCDYWRSRGATMADWSLTFKRWARAAHDGTAKPCGCQPRAFPGQPAPGSGQAALDAKRAASDLRVAEDQKRYAENQRRFGQEAAR